MSAPKYRPEQKHRRHAQQCGADRPRVKNGKATAYDEVVSKALAVVLTGGKTDITKTLTEQDLLNLELDVFMELVKNKGTMDRLEHMLETGKPLRN